MIPTQSRIDETEAYDLGWKEGREIQNFIPVPDKWADAAKARIFFKIEDVRVTSGRGCVPIP